MSATGVTPSGILKLVDVADDGSVTEIRPFVHDPAADYEYFGTFSPDGTGILFASQAGCVYQAWLAPVADPTAAVAVGEPVDHPMQCAMVNTSPWFGIIPWISPDGTRMVAITSEGDANLAGGHAGEDTVRLGGVDGTDGTLLDLTTSGGLSWQRVAP